MGFFDKFKGSGSSSEEEFSQVPWVVLGSMDQLDTITEESKDKVVAIFKHSTRCGISRGVLKNFEKAYMFEKDEVKLYFLDLLAHRSISNEIATRFKVPHESPQFIILKDGSVVHHESHSFIDALTLKDFI